MIQAPCPSVSFDPCSSSHSIGARKLPARLGLSRLHYLWSSRERQELLSHAAALGFRHFDVARNYGDGLAEAELGRFLRGQRDRFLVATKYGIPANSLIDAFRPIGQPLRVVQSVGRRMGLFRMAHPPLTAEGLRASVERSLRALRIDCIDLLLLHEPSLAQCRIPARLSQRWTGRNTGARSAASALPADMKLYA